MVKVIKIISNLIFMKCPNCNKKISLLKIRNEFNCPYCNEKVITKNGIVAILIAFFFWFFIVSPFAIVSSGSRYAMISEIIGFLIAYLIFRSILELEIK